MSLETGKKLGLTASIISLVTPVVIGIIYVTFFFSLLSSVGSVISNGQSPNSLLSFPVLGVLVVAMAGLAVAGFICFIIAMFYLSRHYSEPGIFRNILYAIIISIVGSVVLVIGYIGFILIAVGNFVVSPSSPVYPTFGVIAALLIMIVVAFAISIVYSVLVRRAFSKLADKSGVEHFRTAGLLFLIGAFVPVVGYVAWVFAALGFNRLAPSSAATNAYATTPPVSSSIGPVKRCLNCGAENSPDAIYCATCGKPLSENYQ